MRAVLQRVLAAEVRVGGEPIGATGKGLLILFCAMAGDSEAEAARLATKTARLRIFKDDQGKMNLSVRDIGGGALVVSQFTLAADLRGNRPGFSTAAPPEIGERLYQHFSARLAAEGVPVANGRFGADMEVSLVNDGPVTIWIDTDTAGSAGVFENSSTISAQESFPARQLNGFGARPMVLPHSTSASIEAREPDSE